MPLWPTAGVRGGRLPNSLCMSEPSGLTSLDAKTENHPSVEWNSVREKDTVGVRSEPDNAVQLGEVGEKKKRTRRKNKKIHGAAGGAPAAIRDRLKKKGRARVHWRLMSCAAVPVRVRVERRNLAAGGHPPAAAPEGRCRGRARPHPAAGARMTCGRRDGGGSRSSARV